MKSNGYNDASEKCLKEMFRRVGEVYPNPKLTSEDNWYTKRNWSIEDQASFKRWMIDYLQTKFGWGKKKCEWESDMFLLDRGWTTKKTPTPV